MSRMQLVLTREEVLEAVMLWLKEHSPEWTRKNFNCKIETSWGETRMTLTELSDQEFAAAKSRH